MTAPQHTGSVAPRGRAFTLVELLVVIGIISVIIAMLLPAMNAARQSAYAASCSSNERQIALAFLMFANEHGGRLPGNWSDFADPDPEKRAWLRNRAQPLDQVPESGTVYHYLNSRKVYLCPAQEVGQLGSGSGSNGRFDYSAIMAFTGAKLTWIKDMSRFDFRNGHVELVPTPLIVEEAEDRINGSNIEGGHCNTDVMAHSHRGGSYYASVDGSVHFFKQPRDCDAWQWSSQSPSGTWASFGPAGLAVHWGWWGRQ